MSRARYLLEMHDEEENYVIPPNRMYRGDGAAVMDQSELDPEHQLQGNSHGYSYNKNTGAGEGAHYPDGKRGQYTDGNGDSE